MTLDGEPVQNFAALDPETMLVEVITPAVSGLYAVTVQDNTPGATASPLNTLDYAVVEKAFPAPSAQVSFTSPARPNWGAKFRPHTVPKSKISASLTLPEPNPPLPPQQS